MEMLSISVFALTNLALVALAVWQGKHHEREVMVLKEELRYLEQKVERAEDTFIDLGQKVALLMEKREAAMKRMEGVATTSLPVTEETIKNAMAKLNEELRARGSNASPEQLRAHVLDLLGA